MHGTTTILFGFGRRCITPGVPVSLCGCFNLRMWDHVRDDLFVSALALRGDGRSSTAIVQFDWAVMPLPVVQRIRQAIADIAGLDPLNVIFTCTHAHTSPEPRHEQPGYSESYTSWAVDQASAAVHDAFAGLRPGRVCSGMACVAGVAFNRRYWMRSGRVVTNPPRCSPDIVRPEGTTDPDIPLVGIEHDGRLAVLLASIVNHTDTLGTSAISADWPGVVRQWLESRCGPDLYTMPLIGTAGNINHIDATKTGAMYAEDYPDRIGQAYGSSIEQQLDQLVGSDAVPFGIARHTFVTTPRQIDPDELARAKADSQKYSTKPGEKLTSEDLAVESPAALKYFADALLKVAADRRDKQYEVIAIRIADIVLISLPGEPFVEIGLKIKHQFLPGKRVLLISHGNAAANYIPLPENFAHGGYETTPLCSPHHTDTAQRLLAAVRQALGDLGFSQT